MKLHDIVETSRRVTDTGSRIEKVRALAECLARVEPGAIRTAIGLFSGELRQGRIGLGASALFSVSPAAASEPTLTLEQVDAALDRVGKVKGTGSGGERVRLAGELLSRATAQEQDFLIRASSANCARARSKA